MQKAGSRRAGRQTDKLQVNRNRQVAKQALGSQEELTMQAARRKAQSRNAAVTKQAGMQQAD
jgi:hypothetical protein